MSGSAPGLLAILTEPSEDLHRSALDSLHSIVETEWPQIADELDKLTALAKRPLSYSRNLAALLASKTYYHLGKLDEAVEFAIWAESEFVASRLDDYTAAVIAHSIKRYIQLLHQPNAETPPALTRIVTSVLQSLIEADCFAKCLCLAIETRSLDFVRFAIGGDPTLVTRAVELTLETVADTAYRRELLQLFVAFARDNRDKFQLAQLFHALRDQAAVADLLVALRRSLDSDNWLFAFQVAFELAENASQKFRSEVIDRLPRDLPDLIDIVKRKRLLDMYLQFLFKNNWTDIQIIVTLKEMLNSAKMLVHSSVIAAYSFMFAGTGDDNFYRSNTIWLSGGRKWSQFMTIAAVGGIHIGHLGAALQVLQPFLQHGIPQYALGGAFTRLVSSMQTTFGSLPSSTTSRLTSAGRRPLS
jgi:26S proteasome regulatory subunit N2